MSRETRLLLTTAFVAVAALWGLARVRFPDRPPSPNPVAPILTQLAARPALDDLAADIAELQPRLEPLFVIGEFGRPALRIRPDRAALLLDRARPLAADVRAHVVGLDPASGLAVVSVPESAAGAPASWMPEDLLQPRYLVATDASTPRLTLHPVFVGSLAPIATPLWPGEIWLVPAHTELIPGSFVFTGSAQLAGLVVDHGDRLAIVPSALLHAEIERLMVPSVTTAGYAGIDVQSLTPALARATGASSGVVVTWIDPAGPAADVVAAGDVLEAANDQPLPTPLHWQARTARLMSGEQLVLRLRRGGDVREVTISAAALRARPPSEALGLALEARPGAGSLVNRVDPGSISERAGIRAGDVITRVAGVEAPAPSAIRRVFGQASADRPVLVALTRGAAHHVVALEK